MPRTRAPRGADDHAEPMPVAKQGALHYRFAPFASCPCSHLAAVKKTTGCLTPQRSLRFVTKPAPRPLARPCRLDELRRGTMGPQTSTLPVSTNNALLDTFVASRRDLSPLAASPRRAGQRARPVSDLQDHWEPRLQRPLHRRDGGVWRAPSYRSRRDRAP